MVRGPLIVRMAWHNGWGSNHDILCRHHRQLSLVMNVVDSILGLESSIRASVFEDWGPSIAGDRSRIRIGYSEGIGKASVFGDLGRGPRDGSGVAVGGGCFICPVKVRRSIEVATEKHWDFVGIGEVVRHQTSGLTQLRSSQCCLLHIHNALSGTRRIAELVWPIWIGVQVDVPDIELKFVSIDGNSTCATVRVEVGRICRDDRVSRDDGDGFGTLPDVPSKSVGNADGMYSGCLLQKDDIEISCCEEVDLLLGGAVHVSTSMPEVVGDDLDVLHEGGCSADEGNVHIELAPGAIRTNGSNRHRSRPGQVDRSRDSRERSVRGYRGPMGRHRGGIDREFDIGRGSKEVSHKSAEFGFILTPSATGLERNCCRKECNRGRGGRGS